MKSKKAVKRGPDGRFASHYSEHSVTLAELEVDTEELTKKVAAELAKATVKTVVDGSIAAHFKSRLHDVLSVKVRFPALVLQPAPEAVPKLSELLLACFARRGRAEEMLGDAESEFRQMVARLGARRARVLYRVYVLRVVCGTLPGMLGRLWLVRKMLGL